MLNGCHCLFVYCSVGPPWLYRGIGKLYVDFRWCKPRPSPRPSIGIQYCKKTAITPPLPPPPPIRLVLAHVHTTRPSIWSQRALFHFDQGQFVWAAVRLAWPCQNCNDVKDYSNDKCEGCIDAGTASLRLCNAKKEKEKNS